jgi:hypothetical protein
MISASELESLLEENQSLRDEVRRLQSRRSHSRDDVHGVTRNRLCEGCYGVRRAFASLIGADIGAAAWVFLDASKMSVEAALGLTSDVVKLIGLSAPFVCAALLYLAVLFDWKWRLFKAGHTGLLRGIAECRRAFQEGRGRK